MMTAAKLWQYSLEKYAANEVKQACLILQDEYAYNVNMLLFCMLCDSLPFSLKVDTIVQLQAHIFSSDLALAEHRKIRKNAKITTERVTGFDDTAVASDVYSRLLKQELALEAAQQEMIVACFNALTNEPCSKASSLFNYTRAMLAAQKLGTAGSNVTVEQESHVGGNTSQHDHKTRQQQHIKVLETHV